MNTLLMILIILTFIGFVVVFLLGIAMMISNIQDIDKYEPTKYNLCRIGFIILGFIIFFVGLFGMTWIASHY